MVSVPLEMRLSKERLDFMFNLERSVFVRGTEVSGLKCFSCRRTSISKVREVFKLPVMVLQAVWCGWSTGHVLAGGKMRMGW